MNLLLENIGTSDLKKYIDELYNYCLDHLKKIDRHPDIILEENQDNADDLFGKTGYYDPHKEEIHLFITDRHPKDILRSLAHEMVHHEQNCRGDNDSVDVSITAHDPAYASHDPGLREMERDAFERGNMIFRDWCDMKKMERTQLMEKKIKIKFLNEKEMTGPQVKKAHKLGKKLKGKPNIDEPYALATSMVQKGLDEVSYEESGLEHPEKADLNKDKDISGYEEKRGSAIEKSMGEAQGEDSPEELDFDKTPKSHRKAGMLDFEKDPEAEEMPSKEDSEDELDVSPMDTAQSLARQIKASLKSGDMDSAKDLTTDLIMFLQKNPHIKLKTKKGKHVDVSGVKTEAGTGFGEGPEGKERLSENKDNNPHPELFEKKERALKERFEKHEELVYQELLKRFIK